MKECKENKLTVPNVMEGLIFIPDISGFTELVRSTDLLTGKQITCELLSAVISRNKLNLNISEIEGDAVLFYRYGKAPGVYELITQYKAMEEAFQAKLMDFVDSIPESLNLSLKVIAHYGQMTEYKIGPFNKLYGEVVVESHNLLKNSLISDSYLLLTDALLEKIGNIDDEILVEYGVSSNKLCEMDGYLKNICFTCLDFTSLRNNKKVA